MTGSDAYDEQFRSLIGRVSVEDAFWEMAIEDVVGACGILRGVHDASGGTDGFVSLEVSPVWPRIPRPPCPPPALYMNGSHCPT